MSISFRIGVIGCGNMAKAILAGVLEKGTLQSEQITVFDVNREQSAPVAEKTGISIANSIEQLCQKSDILLLAIKPDVVPSVLHESASFLKGKAMVSIAAGITFAQLKAFAQNQCRVLRTMPNTPAMVGAGATVFANNHDFEPSEIEATIEIFSAVGIVKMLKESLMDAVVGMSGSGPAYVYLFIEAMADGGVRAGLDRATALELAAQTVLGSAKMMKESGMHPGQLKDMVCSPGGTTIEAVYALEKNGFRGDVMQAVAHAAKKSSEMSRENE